MLTMALPLIHHGMLCTSACPLPSRRYRRRRQAGHALRRQSRYLGTGIRDSHGRKTNVNSPDALGRRVADTLRATQFRFGLSPSTSLADEGNRQSTLAPCSASASRLIERGDRGSPYLACCASASQAAVSSGQLASHDVAARNLQRSYPVSLPPAAVAGKPAEVLEPAPQVGEAQNLLSRDGSRPPSKPAHRPDSTSVVEECKQAEFPVACSPATRVDIVDDK